jgi:hypothetical protein
MTPEPIDAHGPRPAVRSAAGSGWLSTTLDGPKKRRVRDQVEAPVRLAAERLVVRGLL